MGISNKLKEYWKNYKDKRKKDKLFNKRQKQIVKNMEKLNDEVEKEYKEIEKKENAEKYKDISKKEKLIKDTKEFFVDLLNNDELKEAEKLLTDKQKAAIKEQTKEEKKITIKAISIFTLIIIIFIILILIFGELIKTDLEKVTQPMLEEYYKNTFGEKKKVRDIRYLDKEKHIALATFTSNINVICIDNETIGTDATYDSIYQDYKNYLINTMQATNFIINNPKLIYRPYVVEYNYYIDYIDVLPSSLTFNQMLNSNNLDIIDIIIYEGNINKTNIQSMLNKFGDNSKIYLLKSSSQNILNLSIVTKEEIKSFDVVEEKYSNDYDIFYQFDQEINKIEYTEIINMDDTYDNENNHYINGKTLKFSTSYLRNRSYDEEDTRDEYFLVRINKNRKYDNFRFVSGYSSYREMEYKDYPDVVTINSPNGLVLIGTNERNVTFANQDKTKVSWICRIGLC